MFEINDRIDVLSHLISPRRDINRPIYNWHSFKHSYSKELVDLIIKEFNLNPGSWVMDPFCGGGTTLLACKDAGINAHGFDILPFSVFLSNVKIRDYAINSLLEARKQYGMSDNGFYNKFKLPDIPILKKAFSKEVEKELLQINNNINRIEDPYTRDFFKLGLLSILESVSNTSKSGGFLRIVNKNIRTESIREIFLNKIDSMIKDIESYNQVGNNHAFAEAFLGDARKIPSKYTYDAVITSPPYPNRHDYTRIYSLEMMFDFVKDNDEIKRVRYETLRSHVEARKKYDACNYSQPIILQKLIRKVEKNGVNNPQVIDMLEGYFEDMFLVLIEMKNHLKKNGKIALVVSNVRFAGINLPVDEILAEIGYQTGLKTKEILVVRYRGNSSQQMGKYKKNPSRESIIIWEN